MTLTKTAAPERIPAIDALRAAFAAMDTILSTILDDGDAVISDELVEFLEGAQGDLKTNQERMANGVFNPPAPTPFDPVPFVEVEVPRTPETIDATKKWLEVLNKAALTLAAQGLPIHDDKALVARLEAIGQLRLNTERVRDNLACMLNAQRRIEKQNRAQSNG